MMTNSSVRKLIFSTMSWQIIFLIFTTGITLINVSMAHSCNKNRLCQLLCCGDARLPDVRLECDKSCNECKTNNSVGDVCERMKHNGQLRKCNSDFTCAVNCRQECDVVEREGKQETLLLVQCV
ncbi:uncharacterized protein LOC117117456 isoform X1 [Anneissia japonica]|uniref:uncharacterized protein LOC117117456 isoform X1 n=1 Tax=Anneissia japonica TaxID=1529436 RepID=UPI00142555BC|nr:uncharacterized protein LOC117117456 isoform X1 [Anneissia japonica]